MVRPWAHAFFYLWPASLFPMRDGRFISFQGAAHRPLAAPAQLGQDAADMVGVVFDAALLLNQARHALAGPQGGGISAGLRAGDQALLQGGEVFRAQARLASSAASFV